MDTLDTVNGTAPRGSMTKIGIKYAIIGAIIFMLIDTLIPYMMGNLDVEKIYESMEGGGGVGAVVSSLGLTVVKYLAYTFVYFSAVKEYRALNGGFISMGQGFKVSYVSVIGKAIIIAMWTFIFFEFIHPEYLHAFQEVMGEQLTEVEVDDDAGVLDTYREVMAIIMSPIGMAISTLFSTLTGGAVLSVIAAAIGKRERTL